MMEGQVNARSRALSILARCCKLGQNADMAVQIIFLHGASSAGKSTLARALQDVLPSPYWHVSIDKIRDAGVLPDARFASGDFAWEVHRQAFFDGFHGSLVAFADAGNNLIVEHIFDDETMRDHVQILLAPFDVIWVGLHTPLDVLTAREVARADRRVGSAAEDFGKVHHGMRYDLELDGTATPDANVARVIEMLNQR